MTRKLADELSTMLGALKNARRIVLTTHVNPDGDGLGCEVALHAWLSAQGIDTTIINHSPTPTVYTWLDPDGIIHHYDPARDDDFIRRADIVVLVDANQPERLRSMQQAVLDSPATKAVIDHHLEPHPFASLTLLDDDATSTGELVYRLLTSDSDRSLTPRIASALYCAIMTDTGSFRYPRVDAEIHRIAAHLIENGADPVLVYSLVYDQWSDGRIRLLGEMLAGLNIVPGGRVAHVSVTQDMLSRTGTKEEDTDNFTVYPMSIRNVDAGILFMELRDGVKISFRSRGDLAINELAKEFGGNGHKNAAGARISGRTLAEVRTDVLRAAARFVGGNGG